MKLYIFCNHENNKVICHLNCVYSGVPNVPNILSCTYYYEVVDTHHYRISRRLDTMNTVVLCCTLHTSHLLLLRHFHIWCTIIIQYIFGWLPDYQTFKLDYNLTTLQNTACTIKLYSHRFYGRLVENSLSLYDEKKNESQSDNNKNIKLVLANVFIWKTACGFTLEKIITVFR